MATPSVSQQTDPLNTIFLGLRNKSPETRLQSALELRRYVRASAADLQSPLKGIILGCLKGDRNVLRCSDEAMGGFHKSKAVRSRA
jgi:hypothetical protein